MLVEDHLGEGAFGYVFKGVIRGPLRNPKLSSKLKQTIGLPVAIKLLKGIKNLSNIHSKEYFRTFDKGFDKVL